jgi:sterol desaturase/sphingolipid hydroxylase (fatty acid hydroxylase superfamily)
VDTTLVDRALGSNFPYITYAVPVFFILIGVELAVALWQHRATYRLHDSINDLSCGITEQIIGLFLKGGLFLGYLGTYAFATRAGINLVDIPSYGPGGKWAAAIILFFGVDCAYYWFHRIAHECSAPWAGHVVHHSSEDYNLAVALRQGTFQGLFSWIFYLPLALVGFPPAWFAAVSSFDTLYQFWIHTRLIGKLGPLEWVLNTPSHHRVHHARNPKYLDKNYAGTLIIWDRMFGTFQAEEEEPVYGLVKPLNSWNPLWANLHVWHELFRDAWLAPRLRDKFRIWFMPPGWRPEGLPPNPPPPEVSRETSIPFDTVSTRGMNAYAFVQFILTLAGAFGLLAAGGGLPRGSLMIAAVLVLWSLLNLGGIFECRSWVFASELARLSCIGVYGAYRLSGAGLPASVAWAVIFAVVASLCAFVYVWQRGNSPSPVVAARPETLGSELGFPQRAASEPEALGRSLSGTAAGRSR